MKKIILIAFILLGNKYMYAQNDNNRIQFSENKSAFTPPIVPCNPNTFWAIYEHSPVLGTTYDIEGFEIINGQSIISNGLITTGVPYGALAYCDDLNLGIGKTFYSIDSDQTGNIIKFNGTSWDYYPIINNQYSIFNCGGKDSMLIFMASIPGQFSKYLLKYNGFSLTTFGQTNTFESFTVADIVIQSNNNILAFVSADSNFLYDNKLIEFSYFGTINNIYEIKMPINTTFIGAYGSFIVNNVLYVGLSQFNLTNPNKIIPFVLINDTLIAGNPIPFATYGYPFDLESCNQGTLTSVKEVPEEYKQLSLYPNPAQEQFTVYVPYGVPQNALLQVYSITGELIEEKHIYELRGPISCQNWVKGVYVVTIQVPNGSGYRAKLVKI